MKRQKSLMMKNRNNIYQAFLHLNVIHQIYSPESILVNHFLFSASNYLCLKGCEFIKERCETSKMILHETNADTNYFIFQFRKKEKVIKIYHT